MERAFRRRERGRAIIKRGKNHESQGSHVGKREDVPPGDSLSEAARQMWEGDCGCLPVLGDDHRVVGMITDRDACMAAYTQGRPMREIRVESAMSRNVLSCHFDDELETAEAIMRDFQVRRLPVMDREGRTVGIISINDLARQYEREQGKRRKDVNAEQVAETLAAICSHPNGARHPSAALVAIS